MWFVGDCDYWYGYARDLVVNAQPPEPYVRAWSEVAKKDRAYREAFATLNDEQREAVLRLVRNVVEGTMFSALVTLDQFAHANVVVELRNRDEEAVYRVQAVPGQHGFGIHERWHEWVTDFSSRSSDFGSPAAG